MPLKHGFNESQLFLVTVPTLVFNVQHYGGDDVVKRRREHHRGYGNVQILASITLVAIQVESSGSCSSTFFSALVQLIPCRAAVAPFSPIPPNEACCNALKSLGQPCLCVLVNGPPISGVDRNMASLLPEKCTTSFDPCMCSSSFSLINYLSLFYFDLF
ncbi:putative lipid-transfer protein DIR1 [Lotus japonicus]|uniref:putative lipid-transfer protein DIR1 n=1 Tax=Lotus japonicus TaxID=34305 RepID=UPI0025849416|nr:putative lipid-transfer protein DIR1 [Lotus japonicus]